MIECSFATLLGYEVPYKTKYQRESAIRFIQGDRGVLSGIEGIEEAKKLPGIVEIELYKEIGDSIRKPENSNDRIGHVIAVGKDAEEASYNADNALSLIEVRVVNS